MEIEICHVYFEDFLAGALIRTRDQKYLFAYFEDYLRKPSAKALSISLPLQKEPFKGNRLFPFFEGLLSEGWLKKIQSKSQKIDAMDSFTMLAKNGGDLIGSVSIKFIENGKK